MPSICNQFASSAQRIHGERERERERERGGVARGPKNHKTVGFLRILVQVPCISQTYQADDGPLLMVFSFDPLPSST